MSELPRRSTRLGGGLNTVENEDPPDETAEALAQRAAGRAGGQCQWACLRQLAVLTDEPRAAEPDESLGAVCDVVEGGHGAVCDFVHELGQLSRKGTGRNAKAP